VLRYVRQVASSGRSCRPASHPLPPPGAAASTPAAFAEALAKGNSVLLTAIQFRSPLTVIAMSQRLACAGGAKKQSVVSTPGFA
jgi:hypothetical protein